MSDTSSRKTKTLTDDEITSRPGIGRRSFLLGAFGGATALSACVPATTYVGGVTGITDADAGAYADPAGNGRGGVRATGLTDSDGGPRADPAGNGRGGSRGYTGLTDSDGGPYADAGGYGRG